MSVNAQDVMNLRRMTGAGLMDCKKALAASSGDVAKAKEFLRKQGQKLSEARAERNTSEGCVLVRLSEDQQTGMMLVLSCETDFVAKNELFVSLSEAMAELALAHRPADANALLALEMEGLSVKEHLNELVAKIGEKVAVSYLEYLQADCVLSYIHAGDRLGVLVGMSCGEEKAKAREVGKEVAMQIAAMNPMAVDKESLPAEVLQKELEIGKELARKEGKPEAILDKIAQGRLQKFLKEQTLLAQPYVKDPSLSIEKYIAGISSALKVTGFLRRATTD